MQIFKRIQTVTLLLVFCFSFGVESGFSQDLIAKLKYEEAEEAYIKEDFQTTINRIDEVEAILKKTSPKTLYLKIMAQYKLKSPPFSVVESLKKGCSYYLSNYGQIEGIEEKYREIYKISGSIQNYPKTEYEYKGWLETRQKEQTLKELDDQKKGQLQSISDKLQSVESSIDGIKIGMDLSEVPYSTWNYLDKSTGIKYEIGGPMKLLRPCIIYSQKYNSLKVKIGSVGLAGLWVDADTKKVVFVSKYHLSGGKSIIDQAKGLYESFAKRLKEKFGNENIIESESNQPIGKTGSLYSKSINLSAIAPLQIAYNFQNMNYGGVLGTDVKVIETLSIPNLYSK